MEVKQYDVFLVRLDPTLGSEMRKTRPCVILSPDEMNSSLRTVQIAPLTTNPHARPWRVPAKFAGRAGRVALDHIRTVDKQRLVRRAGSLNLFTIRQVKAVIREMLVD